MYIIISTVLPEAKALGTKLNLGSAFLHYGGYMNLKKPMSIEEQIEKIRKHKIVISDEEAVKRILEEISYYRLTGYALQYRAGEDSSEYVEEISFDSICRIYQFDSELRSLLRKYIEKAEVYYRCQIANGFAFAKCTREPYDQHYDKENYYNKEVFQSVIDNFQKEQDYYKDSLVVKHHKKKYGSKMPLWVMVELMSFSGISKLYSAMYLSEKDAIASKIGVKSSTLGNHLHCLAVLRNKCAHAARLYNTEFNPPARFNPQFLKKNPSLKNNSLFAYIYILQKRIPDEVDRKTLGKEVIAMVDKYKDDIDIELMGFPGNYKKLLEGV